MALELSAVVPVEGGLLLADDELVGTLLFVDAESLAAGKPHATPAKLERPYKETQGKDALPRLLAIQDVEALARAGEDTVYLLGSHLAKRAESGWERRADREFLIRARWRSKARELRVKGKRAVFAPLQRLPWPPRE